MQTAYNSHSKTIGDLLGQNEAARLIVPQFQRGYSWEKKHVEAFWKDINRHFRASKLKDGPEKYFLGPIVTLKKGRETIQVLDGQQRLATATIWLAVIRDIARAISKEHGTQTGDDLARDIHRELIAKGGNGYSLELGEMDRSFFKRTVQEDGPIVIKHPTLRSHRNIQTAQLFLKESTMALLGGLGTNQALKLLDDIHLTLRRDLVVAVIPVEDQRDAFQIFETLNDRGLRLSVPDLLLNYLMGAAKPEDHSDIRACCNEMLDEMGTNDISRFLRHMWISRYGDLKDQDLFSALKGDIEKQSLQSLDFAVACSEECTAYNQLLDADVRLGEAVPHVHNLVRLLKVQAALPLLLSTYGKFKAGEFVKIVRWLLVYVTRHSIIGKLDSSDLETLLFQLAKEVREKMVDPRASGSCLAYLRESLTKNAPSDDRTSQSYVDLTLKPQEAKYVLGQLATHLQTKTKEVKINEANIEHIFPQNPDEAEWPDKDKLEPFTWHVGNLTVLGKRLNRNAANKNYAKKKAEYYNKSELTMTLRLAKEFASWDETTIKKRAQSLASLAKRIWGFDNSSRA
jgi:hypothetical protein